MPQSFLNPSSMAPKLPEYEDSFLSGILRNDQRQYFQKAMQDQLALQQMGLEDTSIDLGEKKKDLPVKDLERQSKTKTLNAKMPYLERLAIGEAEDKLGQYDFNAKERPIKYDQLVLDYKKGKSEFDHAKETRTLQYAQDILTKAMSLGPEKGSQFARQEIERLKKADYDLPDWLSNPQSWKPMLSGIQNSVPHLRALDIQRVNDEASIKIAQMREAGENARHRERLNAQQENERLTGPNAIPLAIRTLSDPNAKPERKQWAEGMLKWTAQNRAVELAQKDLANEMANNPKMTQATPQMKEAIFQHAYNRNLQLTLSQFGLASPPPQGDPRAAGGQISQPGQPAKSQDGWGIRALP